MDFWNLSLDMLPNLEIALGNANIYTKGGVIFRVGKNLEMTFLPQGIAGENGGLNTGRVFKDGLGYYLFFGASGAMLLENFLFKGILFLPIKGQI